MPEDPTATANDEQLPDSPVQQPEIRQPSPFDFHGAMRRNTTRNTLCDQCMILPLSWLEAPFCSFSGTCCIALAGDTLKRI